MSKEELMSVLRAGDLESARLYAEELGKIARDNIRSAATEEAKASVYQESMSSFSDALHLARVLRAHISAQLSANSGTVLYQQTDSEQHRWRIQA